MDILTHIKLNRLACLRIPNTSNTSRTAVDLAYKMYGKTLSKKDKNPVVTIHGFMGSKKNWQTMSQMIANTTHRTVIAADVRNHGESPHVASHTYPELASDVLQLLNKLSISQAALIGHSMGGRTAMVAALTQPSKVSHLVVVDVSPVSFAGLNFDFFPRLLDVMARVNFEGVNNAAKGRAVAREAIKASGIVDNVDALQFILMSIGPRPGGQIGWMLNVDALRQNFETIGSFPSEMEGKTYSGPTLFIGGGESDYIPKSDLPGLKRFFPSVELTYVPGVGHNVHAENPATFHKLVTTFLL